MIGNVYAAALLGIESRLVEVEVNVLSHGLPGWSMVGLLETAVKEAKERVASAIRNSGYKLLNRKTIVNLAPGHLKKSGAHFDLPIAIGMLSAWNICKPSTNKKYLFAGELSLTGRLLPINGALLMAITAKEHQLDGVILPLANLAEAKLVEGIEAIGFNQLDELVNFFDSGTTPPQTTRAVKKTIISNQVDFKEVRGQAKAKRALEIAAAGGHNLMMVGPPGTGKTMLAERVPSILPPLNRAEKLATIKILSMHGLMHKVDVHSHERPFRAPHHTASYAGLIGGGMHTPRLGEVSLAHNGVLFLDEVAEFRKDVLEALRQPLESGDVHVVRANGSYTYPARFLLIASMNPCKCGFYNHPRRPCICTIPQVQNYQRKISGPLSDRIDLHLQIEPVPHHILLETAPTEDSFSIRTRVLAARQLQLQRSSKNNALLSYEQLKKHCALDLRAEKLLYDAMEKMYLSARAVHRILKVTRTIADLDGAQAVSAKHFAEALTYRPMEMPIS